MCACHFGTPHFLGIFFEVIHIFNYRGCVTLTSRVIECARYGCGFNADICGSAAFAHDYDRKYNQKHLLWNNSFCIEEKHNAYERRNNGCTHDSVCFLCINGNQNDNCREEHRQNYIPTGGKVNQHKCSVSHNHNYKADKIAETVRNHICKVEAVPNVVELTDNAA